jgi:hypothetical protein
MNNLTLGGNQDLTELDRRGRQTLDLTSEVAMHQNLNFDEYHTNYLQETPKQVLSREYLVFTNQTALSLATLVFNPYSVITSVYPTVINYLRGFRFIRTGVRVRIVPNSTPTQYGVMAVSWVPEVDQSNLSRQWINNNPMLLDLASAEGLDFVIPFISIYDVYELFVGESGPGPTVYTEVLGSLSTDSSIEAPTYNVYVSFHEPEVFGAIPIAQSGRAPDYASLMEAGEITGSVLTAVAPEVGLPVAAVLSGVSVLEGIYSNLKEKFNGYEVEKEERALTYVRAHSYGPISHTVYSPAVSMDSVQ